MNLPLAPDAWFTDRIKEGGGMFDRKSFSCMMRAVDHVGKFRTAIDVGAHVGTWSLGLAERFDSVYAIEPFKQNFDYLKNNVAHKGNIFPINLAFGDSERAEIMTYGRENSGQAHIIPAVNNIAGCVVNVVTLDEWLPAAADVDLIKIDAEGYEYHVLTGAAETIKRCSPVIQVELNGLAERYGLTDDIVKELLNDMGYSLFDQCNKDFAYVKN